MEPGSIQWFILLIILLVLYAYLTVARAALSSRRLRSAKALAEGSGKALTFLLKDLGKPLLALMLARTILWSVFVWLMTVSVISPLVPPVHIVTSVLVALGCLLAAFLLCELLPRVIAKKNPERAALRTAALAAFITILLWPLVAPLHLLEQLFAKHIGALTAESESDIEEELISIVNTSQEDGGLNDEERELINNVFAFGDARAKDVMTPRMDIVALPADASAKEAFEVFKNDHFSRVPVYKDDLDHIIGILHFKDLIFSQNRQARSIKNLLREPLFSYESKLTSELFAQMRSMSSPLAVILDEYGGTAGIVTLEDMVEEIVGDILDEYDEEPSIIALAPHEYTAEGAAKIDAFNEAAGTRLTSEDYDSIGGYVIGLLGDIPSQNEVITDEAHRITFTVTAIDKNRIEKLHIVLHPEEKEEEALDSGE